MKKRLSLFLAVAAMVAVTGCVKDNSGTTKKNFTEEDLASFISEETLAVPVKDGYWSVVTCCGDTLCVTDEAGHVTLIPKGEKVTEVSENASSTANTKASDADGVVISYNLKTVHDYHAFAGDRLWQTIAFEDSKNGDYDYNDLVIHVKWRIRNGGLMVGIHPIAYGATKTISLGLTVYKDGTAIFDDVIASNCKSELFDNYSGTQGYINTAAYDKHYTKFAKIATILATGSSASWNNLEAAWWITTSDGSGKIYSVNRRFAPNELLDSNGRPYGLVITKLTAGYEDGHNIGPVGYNWFFYPKEGINLWNYYQVSGGVFGYQSGVDGPDVNDFILKTGSDAINQLYSIGDTAL